MTGDASGPYRPWQVTGSILSLIAVTAAAGRWLPLVTVVVTVPVTCTAAFTVGAAVVASLAALVRDVRAPRTGPAPPRPTASARPPDARRR